jgi:hypothetical protein
LQGYRAAMRNLMFVVMVMVSAGCKKGDECQ